MKHIISLFACLLLLTSTHYGQYSTSDLIKSGDQALANKNYFAAMKFFGEALQYTDGDADLWFKYGEAALGQNGYNIAETAFEKYLNDFDGDRQGEALYNLANVKHLKGDYDAAIEKYNLYKTEYGDDPMLTKKIEAGIEAAEWAKMQPTENDEVDVYVKGDGVNTEFSEQGAYLLDDKFYYASLRYPFGSKKDQTLISKVLVNNDGTNEPIEELGVDGVGNMTSNPSFSPDGQHMVYTICNYTDGDKIICNLYRAENDGTGNYLNPIALSSVVNMAGYTATQPNIKVVDEEMTLYYVSDRLGGNGGLDIWYVQVDGDWNLSTPQNWRENTSGDDITPFFHHATKTLYFASNARKGFGGFDIYKAEGSTITNLGSEFNTSYNDIYFYLNEDGTKAFFSSNRLGSKHLDNSYETCCYDIYEADLNNKTIDLLALIFDANTNEALNDSRIILKDLVTGEIIFDSNNPDGNDYKVKIRCDREYELQVFRDGYKDHSSIIGPYTEDCGKGEVTEKVYMQPSAFNLTVNTWDKTTRAELAGVDVKLVCISTGKEAVKNTGTGNSVTFSVDPNCPKYKLTGLKSGYEKGDLEFDMTGVTGNISKDLYLDKIQIATLKGLVPVRLYFDNDHPNPRSTNKTTQKTYTETFNSYYPKKAKFATNFASEIGMGGSQAVFQFFEGEVKRNHDNLQLMLKTLVDVLESGQKVNLFLRGYASPLAKTDYNLALGQRRVDSVRKELYRWNSGRLLTFINSGQLVITERSFGENTAPTGISDDYQDRKNSVYSPEASRERRVEIDEIKFDN